MSKENEITKSWKHLGAPLRKIPVDSPETSALEEQSFKISQHASVCIAMIAVFCDLVQPVLTLKSLARSVLIL